MKKMLALVMIAMMMLMQYAVACGYDWYEYQDELYTTLVVADKGWNYNVRVNARIEPDIKAPVVDVFDGGTMFNVIDFYYADDGRIWAEIWHDGSKMYISTRYLQPLEEGAFFYLSMKVDVLKKPEEDAVAFSEFVEDQLILVDEIIENDFGYWAKVLADGQYGYIQLVLLDAL